MSNNTIKLPDLDDIHAAAKRIAPYCVRSPLLPLETGRRASDIYLKLENLQHIGVFKMRSISNILLCAEPEELERGVYTLASGNGGLGLAWLARELEINARIYAPLSAQPKLVEKMKLYGASVKLMDDAEWWQLIVDKGHPDENRFYVDAVRSEAALAGNGTVALEILEQLPAVENIIVPFGGGGLACGIATVIKALKSATRLIVAECDSATPVQAALEAGRPVQVETRPSFITSSRAPIVLEDMWPLLAEFVDESIVVSADQVADAVRILFNEKHVVAEGSGALPLAAALADDNIKGKTVCLVSGGNIDSAMMSTILARQTPA